MRLMMLSLLTLGMLNCCGHSGSKYNVPAPQAEPFAQCVQPMLIVEFEPFASEPVGLDMCRTELDGSACCAYGPRDDSCMLLMCRSTCNGPWVPIRSMC